MFYGEKKIKFYQKFIRLNLVFSQLCHLLAVPLQKYNQASFSLTRHILHFYEIITVSLEIMPISKSSSAIE